MHIAFLPQHWLHENASVLSYTYSTLPGLLINSEINTRRMILKKYVSFVWKTPNENVIWGIHAQLGGRGFVVWMNDENSRF